MTITLTEPDGSQRTYSLVEETAADYQFDDLMTLDLKREWGDLRFTAEQLANMDATVLRKFAQYATSDAINGRSTRLEVQAFFGVQTSLTDFADGK